MPAARRVWLDVDGTSETGEPCFVSGRRANLTHPPLGRPYNYNFPLFDALDVAPDVDLSAVLLFTAYDAYGAGHTKGVLRCELLDWIAEAHPRIKVAGVATVIDPAFGHGPGAYYRAVIEPCERFLLEKSGSVAAADSEVVTLSPYDIVGTLSPEDWSTVVPTSYGDLLQRQHELVTRHLGLGIQVNISGGPRMDKERLARYCLGALPAAQRVLFLDDNPDYIRQVERACEECGAECLSVHVTPDLRNTEAFLRRMDPALRCDIGCAVS